MTEAAVTDPNGIEPWYRHGWVWFVMLVPFSAVLFGVVMIVSANHQPDDLVVDDYYKAGMGINQRLEQDQHAVNTGATVKLVGITPGGVMLDIGSDSDEVQLMLFHVSDSASDIEVSLTSNGMGMYTTDSTALVERLTRPGVWYLEVKDTGSGWRLRERIETPLGELVMGSAHE